MEGELQRMKLAERRERDMRTQVERQERELRERAAKIAVRNTFECLVFLFNPILMFLCVGAGSGRATGGSRVGVAQARTDLGTAPGAARADDQGVYRHTDVISNVSYI